MKDGYFSPGDQIRIYHMHPGEPLLQSHLPLIRHRAFIRQQQGEDVKFVEAPLHFDTVRLWPEQQRGLMLARDCSEQNCTVLKINRISPAMPMWCHIAGTTKIV